MVEIFASAMPVADSSAKGVHLAWVGPAVHPYAVDRWIVERRLAGQIPSGCETIHIGRITAPEERAFGFGSAILAPGTFPIGGVPATVATIELSTPTAGLHGRIQGATIAAIVGMRHGKAVSAIGPLAGPYDLGPAYLDRVTFYLANANPDTGIEICRYAYDKSVWTGATQLASLQLPLREFMGAATDELHEAQSRLLPGESIDPEHFADIADMLRSLAASPRAAIRVRRQSDDEFDEMAALDPIRMLYASPTWRRGLGFSLFDRDPTLVAGQRYDYRISARFPAAQRVIGFHTIPSGTQLPSDFYLHDCRIRLARPSAVEISAATGNLLQRTRRGVRLAGGGFGLPWVGLGIDDCAAVIDLPAPVQNLGFELEPGHALTLEAGFAWGGFTPAVAIPPGATPSITLAAPASQLRLRGKGLLEALIVEPVADALAMQILPNVLVGDTPRPAPPLSAVAASLQQPTGGNANAPRKPLGMTLHWEPATMVNGWSPPGLAPPIDAAGFAVERRIEPDGAWEAVIGADEPVFGSRPESDDGSAPDPGADLMLYFPEEPQPDAETASFDYEDIFLKDSEGEGETAPPPPGTFLRYRISSIDWAGRRSTTTTETAPARLEKHEPPPLPAAADPRTADQLDTPGSTGVTATVLAKGGDMSPEQAALLGTADNVIVLEWGWRAHERDIDSFATQFRIYIAPPLDAVACTILSVTPVPARLGAYQVTAHLERAIDPGAAQGQYLSATYPFYIESHTPGSDITLILVTRLPGPTGAFSVPALGTTSLPLNHVSRLTRPTAWSERLATLPITSEERYQFVLPNRLQFSEDHPRDALWIGVSAADDQSYVSDSLAGPTPLPGNESAIATVLCQGKWLGRPHYDPPPPAPDVARLVTTEPQGGSIAYRLDLAPFLAGSGIPAGKLLLVERLDAADLLTACRVDAGALLGTSGTNAAPIAIPNPQDAQAILDAVTSGAFDTVLDRQLVLLAALHPFRGTLFKTARDTLSPDPLVDDSLPSSAARYLYRVRAASAGGQLSPEGFILPAIIRVPSSAPGPAPLRLPLEGGDSPDAIRIGVKRDSVFTHLLVFEASLALGEGRILRVPNRPDLLPAGNIALGLADGTMLAPVAVPRAALDASQAYESHLHAFSQPADGPVHIWAVSLTADGMISPAAGPWRVERAYAPPVLPVIAASVTGTSLRLDWDWAGTPPVPVTVERATGADDWTRASPPFLAGKTGFDTVLPPSGTRFRLRATTAASNEVEV